MESSKALRQSIGLEMVYRGDVRKLPTYPFFVTNHPDTSINSNLDSSGLAKFLMGSSYLDLSIKRDDTEKKKHKLFVSKEEEPSTLRLIESTQHRDLSLHRVELYYADGPHSGIELTLEDTLAVWDLYLSIILNHYMREQREELLVRSFNCLNIIFYKRENSSDLAEKIAGDIFKEKEPYIVKSWHEVSSLPGRNLQWIIRGLVESSPDAVTQCLPQIISNWNNFLNEDFTEGYMFYSDLASFIEHSILLSKPEIYGRRNIKQGLTKAEAEPVTKMIDLLFKTYKKVKKRDDFAKKIGENIVSLVLFNSGIGGVNFYDYVKNLCFKNGLDSHPSIKRYCLQ